METTRTTVSPGTVSSAADMREPSRRSFDAGTVAASPPGSPVPSPAQPARPPTAPPPPPAPPDVPPPPPPLTPAEVVAALDPGLVARLAAWRVEWDNWIAAGRAMMDRAADHIHDAKRR